MVGRILDQYRVLEKLGAGGMGEVWRALDLKLEREVALKLLPSADAADPSSVARFLREARSASALNHPNIVTIYQAGSAGDTHYIAMELLRGRTLADLLKSGPLPIPQAADIACQIGQALAHAHRMGIIHRDLKPANVILTGAGTAKVLDFGLARRVQPAQAFDETATALTMAGAVAGTLEYMSPEQAAGDALDARSDLFSFGVVLFEMLAGKRPFRGDSRQDIVRNIMTADPPALRGSRSDIPEALEAIVHRCLRKSRAERFERAEDVVAAIRAAIGAGAATEPRRIRWWVAAGLAAAIAAAAAMPPVRQAVVSQWRRIAGAPAAVSADSAFDDYRTARGLLDRYDRPGNLTRALDLLKSATRKDPRSAPAFAALSEAYWYRNGSAPDPQWVALALDAARTSVALDRELAIAHTALGYALMAAERRAEAVGEFERARSLDPKSAPPIVGLARIAAFQGQAEDADRLFRKATEVGPSEWLVWLEYAAFLYNNARYAEAIAACEQAGTLAPDNTRVLTTEAAARHMSNQYDEAASLLQRALAIEPNPRIYANLGTLRFFQGRFADAVAPMEKATELQPGNYLYWGNLGDAYRWAEGLRPKSKQAYAKAIELMQKGAAAARSDAVWHARLAGYLAKSQQTAAALAELKEFEDLPRKSGMARFKAAIAYEAAGQRDRALQSLDAALKEGYSLHEIEGEQELVELRADSRYRQMLLRSTRVGTASRTQ